MRKNIKSILSRSITNARGWRTNRKIVVIESDDWGSLRMSSNQAYQDLKNKGVSLDQGAGARYNQYDTLASKEDLEQLFDVLRRVKDKNGKAAKFTAVYLSKIPL